jgi:hypothetical protein
MYAKHFWRSLHIRLNTFRVFSETALRIKNTEKEFYLSKTPGDFKRKYLEKLNGKYKTA